MTGMRLLHICRKFWTEVLPHISNSILYASWFGTKWACQRSAPHGFQISGLRSYTLNQHEMRVPQLRVSIVVSISACHADDPGSIPGRGILLVLIWNHSVLLKPIFLGAGVWFEFIDSLIYQARLAQSVERQALNLMVVGSSPTVGAFFIFENET